MRTRDVNGYGGEDHSLTTISKLHKVMGLTEDKMIASMDVKRGQMLLDDILNGGNFGHYDKHHVLGHNLLLLYRDARLLRYYPAEALSEPMFRTWHFFWRMKNKK